MEAKPTKVTNKNLMLSALEQMEYETGFHVKDVEFGNCYFLFEGDKDSICHFHIKEIPRFKFAFWTSNRVDMEYYAGRLEPKTELIFFTQYERDIDKFKPSHSGFLTGIYRDAWYEVSETTHKRTKQEMWHMYDLVDILQYMHKHPIKSYVYSGATIHDIWDEISGPRALKIYLNETRYHYWYAFKNWHRLNKVLHKTTKLCSKLKNSNYAIILNNDCCSPRIDVTIILKDLTGDYMKDVNIIDRLEEKYFNDITIYHNCEYIVDDVEKEISHVRIDKDMTKSLNRRIKSLVKLEDKISNNTTDDDSWIEKIIKIKI